MTPSIRVQAPVPESAVGGVVPDAGGVPWRVNFVPPTPVRRQVVARAAAGGDVDVVVHRTHDGHDGHVHDLPRRRTARRRSARNDRLTEEVRRRHLDGYVPFVPDRGLVRACGAERDCRRAGSREVRGRTRDHLIFFQILLPLAYIQRAGASFLRASACLQRSSDSLLINSSTIWYMSPNPHLVRPDRETMVRLTSEMNDRQISRLFGCTSPIIAKWRDFYGIPRSPRQSVGSLPGGNQPRVLLRD